MGLKNYKPVRHEISLGDDSFFVRGLSLEDISALVNHHLPDIEALFTLFERGSSLDSDAAFQEIVMAAINQAPGFVANVIALASDEPDAAQEAQQLPGPVQVQALLKIGDLTFKDVGGIKKGMGDIAALLSRLKVDQKTLKRVSGKAA